MKVITKPNITAKDAFLTCISKVKNVDLKTRLTACVNLISQAETEFESKITKGDIHTICKEQIVNGNVIAKELKTVYTDRMAGTNAPGRTIYDKLILAPKNGICPLCSHGHVSTLDHYLPKSDFPRLAVVPINLIPSCFDCNKYKLTTSPRKPEEETLHPYYDNIEDVQWLYAQVNHTTPPTVSFFVKPLDSWSDLLKARVQHHFQSFSLAKLYTKEAAVYISDLNQRLQSIHSSSGAIGVSEYLRNEAISRCAVDKNSWRTAFYFAVADDDWFCDGGFQIS
ncbi:MAG: hypothetical protein LBL13_07520 [Bacteroidales bacterium]|jgi:hypothetical protein|nr:hypothetical protein [Bacteroidales bacterium]